MRRNMFMVAALCLAALSATARAEEEAPVLPQLSSEYVKDDEAFRLAANDTDVLVKQPDSSPR